jgi:hypothetical protein
MSFLRDYDIVSQNNEVPKTFHLYSALFALSSIVSSRIWLDLGLFKIRPNIYVVLTGTPGVKKTTAMSISKRLLRELKPHVPLAAECITKEALTLLMSGNTKVCTVKPGEVPLQFVPLDDKMSKFAYTPISVAVTELSQFVGSGGAAGHMLDFLTTIYDEEIYENRTKGAGTDTLALPYLTLLACTVPDWITARLKDDVITGGFSRRTIFVYESSTGLRVPRPFVTKEMEDAWVRLVNKARHLLTLSGPVQWSEATAKFYDDWYVNLKKPEDPLLEGWYNSVHVQMLKIAMLIAASEWTSGPLVLEIAHMQMSMELLVLIEENIPKVFKGVGRNELFPISHKILDMLQHAPNHTVPERLLNKELYREADVDEIRKLINHLIGTGQVERVPVPHPMPGRPAIISLRLCQTDTNAKPTVTSSSTKSTKSFIPLLNLNSTEFGAELMSVKLESFDISHDTES